MKFCPLRGLRVASLTAAATLAVLAVLPSHGSGTNVSYQFNTVFGAASVAPTGPGPWVNATFSSTAGGVLLTISNYNLVGSEQLESAYFNINPTLNINNLTFSLQNQTGSFTLPTISMGEDAFKAGGDGSYDLQLQFNTTTAGSFGAGESVSYLLAGVPNLSAADFAYLSTPGNGSNPGPFYSSIHIQNTGANANKSAWTAAGSGPIYSAVPEPGAGPLATAALALWGVVCAYRRSARQ